MTQLTRGAVTALAMAAAIGCRGGLDLAAQGDRSVRPPTVAGQFYPGDAAALGAAIDAYLRDAVEPAPDRPIAIVVPHAGLVYSGQIAADAWQQAAGQAYDTVVLLGTNHTAAGLQRAAVFPGTGLRTPLGVVQIDRDLATAIVQSGEASADAAPHASEHSIEVQLPFLQRLFPSARVVAVIVPHTTRDAAVRFGRTLARLTQGRKLLIVASSDLSHYPSARDAVGADRRTLEAIASLDPERLERAMEASEGQVANLATCACGDAPIMAAMAAAAALGATSGRVVSYAHSGDLPIGEPDRVVGYGAVVFSAGAKGADIRALDRPTPSQADLTLPPADRKRLLGLARETIRRYLQSGTVPLGRPSSPGLERAQGLFVTLRKNGALRGCIGQMVPSGPLRQLVGRMALAAAFEDGRFDKVKEKELGGLEIEISLLTPFREVASALAVVPGRDGVLLQKGRSSAVFLPQVATEEGWGRDELLDHLCEKAGLKPGCWRSAAKISTFRAEVFKESEYR